MEINRKIIYIIFCLIVSFFSQRSFAIDYSLPKDLPTIELLIELHKQIKKNETASLAQVTSIELEQAESTNKAEKISEIKTTIHTKLSDINSYLILATNIANTLIELEKLTEEYYEFDTNTIKLVVKKPYTAKYYYNAQKRVYTSVKNLKEKYTLFYANLTTNILKSSMDEKFKMINLLDATIRDLRYVIHTATNYIKYSNMMSFTSIDDLFPEDFKKKAAEKITNQWINPLDK